ncbi:MAG: hypothetical protein ACI9XC_002055 [Gammaproteobacteria bacterium]
MVAAGVFLPLASIPIYGDITYNRIASLESYIVIFLAIIVVMLIFMSKSKMSIFPVAGIWLTLLFPAIKSVLKQQEDKGIFSKFASKVTDPLKDFAVNFITNITEFSWGGYVFMVGLFILTLSSILLVIKMK